MPFQKGHKLAKGGARKNAGRPLKWFKEQMAKIAGSQYALEFVEGCIKGEEVDRIVIDKSIVKAPAPAQVRLAAFCEARDSGYGKNIPVGSGDLIGATLVGIYLPNQDHGSTGKVQ